MPRAGSSAWSPTELGKVSAQSQIPSLSDHNPLELLENPSKVLQELFVVSTGPSLGRDTVTSLGCCPYIKVHIFVLFCVDKGYR